MNMTPIEIFEYKMKWKPESHRVHIHSDLDVQAKDWCRKHIDRTEWSMDTYTDVYEHTFYFHSEHDARDFRMAFQRWTQPHEDSFVFKDLDNLTGC